MAKKSSSQQKNKLANLFRQLSFFGPKLDLKGKWHGEFAEKNPLDPANPTRDQLLYFIGEASIEMKEFMQEHENLKTAYGNAMAQLMELKQQSLVNQTKPNGQEKDSDVHSADTILPTGGEKTFVILHRSDSDIAGPNSVEPPLALPDAEDAKS